MRETRHIKGQMLTFVDIVGQFLHRIIFSNVPLKRGLWRDLSPNKSAC
ncbi:MAG: hypothetical protein ACU0C9_11510 [Paracoccaceae bacterium]